MPSLLGTEPPLTSPSHIMQPPVAALSQTPSVSGAMHHGYPSSVGAPYAPGQSSINEPSKSRNMRGVGIAAGIAVIAIIALVARSGSSDEESAAATVEDAGTTATAAAANPVASPADGPPKASEEPVLPEVKPLPAETSPIIVVVMTSDPVAEVFAVGAVSPLCTTPCDIEIDSADGGSPSRRDFILRGANHKDATITINLKAPRESVFTTLEPAKAPRPTVVPLDTDEPPKTKTGSKTKTGTKSGSKTKTGTKTKAGTKTKPKCKAGAQDTFNPFGESDC